MAWPVQAVLQPPPGWQLSPSANGVTQDPPSAIALTTDSHHVLQSRPAAPKP